MGAFVCDDEGFLFLEGAEFKVVEHVAEFLPASSETEGAHPVSRFPMADREREGDIGDGYPLRLFQVADLGHVNYETDPVQ